MLGKLGDLVTGESVASWLIIAVLVVYFVYKEWPEFMKRIRGTVEKDIEAEQTDKTLEQRLDSIEAHVQAIDEKLGRDYERINKVEYEMKRYKEAQVNTSEELEIIMRALVGVLKGLQEQGANGPTKTAEAEIQDYLNKKAHKV